MRNLLALGAAALIIFLGLGWYLDWYRLKAAPGEDGHRNINIDLNTNKISEDLGKAREKARDWLATKEQTPTAAIPNQTTPGNPTSYRPPNDNVTTPTPPSSGSRLPTPQ